MLDKTEFLDEIQKREHFFKGFLDAFFLWDTIDRREGERGLK